MTPLRTISPLIVVAAFFASSLHAERQRPVRPEPPAIASLTVIVADGATSQAIAGADVESFGQRFTTDGSGSIVFDGLREKQVVTLTVTRSGFDPQTRSVTLAAGSNEIRFLLVRARPAILTLANGSTYQLDANTIEFGYVVAFGGYTKGPFLDVCSDDERFTVQRADLSVLTGPAVSGNNRCCGPAAQVMKFRLKGGRIFYAVLRDSCEGYSMDVIARDLATGKSLFVPLKEVASIEFP